jgi:hypothetical protein
MQATLTVLTATFLKSKDFGGVDWLFWFVVFPHSLCLHHGLLLLALGLKGFTREVSVFLVSSV